MPKGEHLDYEHQRRTGWERIRYRKRRDKLHPPRPLWNLKRAAEQAGLKVYGLEVEYWNPHSTGRRGKSKPGAPCWVSVVVKLPNGEVGAIDMISPHHTKKYLQEKRLGIEERGVHYLPIQPGGRDRMTVEILMRIRKEKLG